MGSLKEDLKCAANLLKTGRNEEVIELLTDHQKVENPDYRALCYTALAFSNISDFPNAYEIYKKAIEIDETNPMAWKGTFKLFELESLVPPDQFSLRICEFMQKNCEDKKETAIRARRRLHVELKLWPEILESFDDFQFDSDQLALKAILSNQFNMSEDKRSEKLLQKTFEAANKLGVLEKDPEIALFYVKHENSLDSFSRILRTCPELSSVAWVRQKMLVYTCKEHFEKRPLPDFASHVSCSTPAIQTILTAIRENDISAALDALELVPSDACIYPESMLFVELLAEQENWEDVERVVLSIQKSFQSPFCYGWLARAQLEIDPDNEDKLLALSEHISIREFAVERLKIAHLLGQDPSPAFFERYSEQSAALQLIALLQIDDTVLPEHLELAEQLSKETVRDLVLAAEVKMRAGLEANTLLVTAAKLNVRCSRAFFLLGKATAKKAPKKSQSLLERAVDIRPGNEEYVRELYELLARKDVPPEDRLKLLKTFQAKRRSRKKLFWLSEALSIAYLEIGDLTEAIDELRQMVRLYKDNKSVWARLAEAYARKGHLRAAVSSYAQLAEMKGGHEFTIPMIRVLIQLRDFDEALEHITAYRSQIFSEQLVCCPDSPIVLDLTEAEVRLNLHEKTCGTTKMAHLKEAVRLLTGCIGEDGSSKYASVFKLLGDVLLVVGRYSQKVLPYFKIDPTWKVSTPHDCIVKAVSFYMTVLKARPTDALSWYDVCVALLAQFKVEPDAEILSKVLLMLPRTLSLTSNDTLRSSIWTLLAEAKRLADHPPAHQLHCLSRALRLNKVNDAAWLKVAVLCLELGLMDYATRVLEQTIKHNPHNADAWCAWAQHAHFEGVQHDALAMFRQALCIRPTLAAVIGYSTYLCDSLKKLSYRFDSATAALNFEPVIDLKNLAGADDHVLYHLGLLADLFGFYPESLECFKLCSTPCIDEIERATIKTSVLYPELGLTVSSVSPSNMRIARMLEHTIAEQFEFLTEELQIYANLCGLIERNDAPAFRSIYKQCIKAINVPLFIAFLITRNINLPLDFVRTMHDALPRHELIDYYPTILPDGLDNGLRHLEQDGEEPFRYRHRAAHRLLAELKVLREKADNAKMQDEFLGLNDFQIAFPI